MILKIFFSWQVETDLQGFNNKVFLKDCIKCAIKQIENKKALKGIYFELIEGLNKTSGNPEVAPLMFSQIDDCDIFIGDMTIVQRICSRLEPLRNKKGLYFRYSPNCNVYGEYNRALGLHKDFWKQIILLLNNTNKSPKEDSSVIPFDTRHRRWPITFNLKDNSVESKTKAKEELMKDLPGAIRKCALAAREWIDKRYYPFSSWFKQSKDGRLNRYKIDVCIVDKYKVQLLESKGVFLVIGPKGLSKTYLILKVFEDDEYANNYLYVDCYFSKFDKFKTQFENILEEIKDSIVIIDNCNSDDIQHVLNLSLKYNADTKIVFITTRECVENEHLNSLITIIDTTQDLQNEISLMFDEAGILLQQTRQQVENFCDGNIALITNVLSKVKEVNSLDERVMVSLMYGIEEDKVERTILKSIALFNSIGWKEDRADELDTIILNKDITSISIDSHVLLNYTRTFIRKLIRNGLIIEKGRTISLYPKSAAQQLVVEWLEDVDEIRFIKVLKAILQSPHCNSLIRQFHDRFKYLGQYDEVRLIVKRLLKIGGGFDNISILNSDAGAMLMESFVQVYPEAVANLLSSVLNALSIDELRKIEEGRRYLIWTIEKLCFKSETFQKGAYLMMRMAIAENESISNNATGEFVRLFPIILPATSAPLNERLMFIKNNINVNEQKPILLSAIKRATSVRDFILMGGAETFGDTKLEPYRPISDAEIRDYLGGCLNLIMAEVKSDDYFSAICEIMEHNTIAMCDTGYADLILPKVKIISEIKHNDWAKMQETLSFFRNRVWSKIDSDSQLLYDEILDSITKQDIVSRFARIEKDSYNENPRLGYKKRLEKQRCKYRDIANEIYEKKLLTNENILGLMKVEYISSYPFGNVLAECMSSEYEQIDFIKKYIQISNENKGANISILCDFISSIGDSTFDNVIPILQKSIIPHIIFACFGVRNIMPDDPKFHLLYKMIEDKTSDVYSYLQYWSRINKDYMTEDRLTILFSDILSFENGFPVAMNIMSFLLWDDKIITYKKLIDIIETKIIEYHSSRKSILNINDAIIVFKEIIRDGSREKLAEVINESIIQEASQNENHVMGHNYDLEEVYRILMNKYFNVIWPSLSTALLSEGEEFMTFYNLKLLLGLSIVDDCKPIIMEGNHFDEMLDWCNDYPDIAPARLASMIPVAGDNNQLTPEALKLISLYADKNYVLDEIECTLDSFFATGSVVPYYEERKKMYSSLLQNERAEVREWAQRRINSCDYYIQHAQSVEEEMF